VAEGFVGSLSVLREAPQTIRRGALRTKAGWSPFEGLDLGGRVTHTIVRGRIYEPGSVPSSG
jgi:dihydroorotase-like cyclic amidohydrolase